MKETGLKIHTWPDNILKKSCKKVENVDSQIKKTFDKMYSLMKKNQGIGLAANQVGLDLSLAVIQVKDKVFKLVNPRIIKKTGTIKFEEGCLSFPGLSLEIKRARKVWVSALNEDGDPLDIEAEGILAVVFQHEIDHINGIVFIDRVSLWKRFSLIPKLKEMSRQ